MNILQLIKLKSHIEANMSNNKWAAVGVAASVVGVAALGGAAAMAYFMLKEDEDFRSR